MTSNAKELHTGKPSCGCKIVHDHSTAPSVPVIEFCPLHESAKAMFQLLLDAKNLLSYEHPAMGDRADEIIELISKAEGKA